MSKWIENRYIPTRLRLAVWVLLGRPVMYRMRTRPFTILADLRNAAIVECYVHGDGTTAAVMMEKP